MNIKKLDQIIANYIDRFEEINKDKTGELYKWRIVAAFRPTIDEAFVAPDDKLHEILVKLWKLTDNLIDNSKELPFHALCEYAKREPSRVKAMLRRLYAEDGGGLKARQGRIRDFLEECAELKEKYFPENWKYETSQRTVMSYLFLYDPDRNYMYKATQANAFADHAGFLDEWGAGVGYRLDVYYRMCDELVAYIKKNQQLLDTNESRYKVDKTLYPDPEYHLLASDIIYCCSVYGLLNGIEPEHITTEAKRLAKERRDKAQALKNAVDIARERADKLEEAREYIKAALHPGKQVLHTNKTMGVGTIEKVEDCKISDNCFTMISIMFAGKDRPVTIGIQSLINGMLIVEDSEVSAKLCEYAEAIKAEYTASGALKAAEAAFAPYAQYLD